MISPDHFVIFYLQHPFAISCGQLTWSRDYYKQLYANKMDNLKETDKFLERCNIPSLNQEEIENMNRLITSTEIGTVMNKLPTEQMGLNYT